MTFIFTPAVVDPKHIVQMAENMTITQIAARLGITEADVEDHLERSGRAGQGNWLLRCQKTGRWWRCHTERACYRKAQMMGLTDYDFGMSAPAVARRLKKMGAK